MDNVYLDLYIKNNEEKYFYENILAKKDNKTYTFNVSGDNYIILLDKKIKLKKENNDSILELIFDLNSISNTIYFIKQMNYNMDIKVETTKLEISNNNYIINYNLWLQEEKMGNYEIKLSIKE